MPFQFSLSTLLFVLSLLPLLAYPAVLVANVMQAAALSDPSLRPKGEAPLSWKRVAMGGFIGGTTAYPVVVIACRFLARTTPHAPRRELAWSAAPRGFLAILAILLCLIFRAETASRK